MGAVVSQEHERPEGAYAKKSFETYSMAAVYRANARARLFLGEQLRRARQREALDTTARMELLHLLATNSTADDDSGADGDEVTAPVEARVVPSSPPAAEKEAAPVAKATRGGKSPDPTPKGSTEGTPKGSKDPTPKPSPVDSSKDNSSDDDAASDDGAVKAAVLAEGLVEQGRKIFVGTRGCGGHRVSVFLNGPLRRARSALRAFEKARRARAAHSGSAQAGLRIAQPTSGTRGRTERRSPRGVKGNDGAAAS